MDTLATICMCEMKPVALTLLCSRNGYSISRSYAHTVRVEFTKDRYIADTENETAVVCLKKTEGDVDFNVTVEARPKEITSEDFFLGEGEEVAKGKTHC